MKIHLNRLQQYILLVIAEHELGETGMWIEMYGDHFDSEMVTYQEQNERIRMAFEDLQSQLRHAE
jgi:hypothetical protein